MKNIEIRKITESDNLIEIANLIYDIDPYIYPGIFGDRHSAIYTIINTIRLSSDKNYILSYDTIYGLFIDDKVCGVMILLNGQYESLYTIRKYVPIAYFDMFAYGYINYFQTLEHACTSPYLMGICVKKSLRSHGLGTLMLAYAKSIYSTLSLDVLADCDRVVKLYERTGFKIKSESLGFASQGKELPQCKYMEYKQPV